MKKSFTLIGFLFALIACNTREIAPDLSRLGYDYFPLEVGQYAIYEVENITYSLTARPATDRYQIKEIVADTFTDISKEKAYRIIRYSRPTTQASWKQDSIWTAKVTSNTAIRTENNVSFVKLAFPVKEGLTWNGNALNDRDQNGNREEYQIKDARKPYELLQNTFDQSLKVVQRDDSSACEHFRKTEVFAKGVGMVFKENISVYFMQINNTCMGTGQIGYGTKFYQRLSSYGKE